jgi:hypothetical protein
VFTIVTDSESHTSLPLVRLVDEYQAHLGAIKPVGEVSPSTKAVACQRSSVAPDDRSARAVVTDGTQRM